MSEKAATGKEKSGRKTPEFNLCCMIAAVEVLVNRGIAKSVAVAVGYEITEHLTKNYGGSQFYISRNFTKEMAQKAAAIYAEFDGSNYRELAEKYGHTEVWIRELVKRGKKQGKKEQ